MNKKILSALSAALIFGMTSTTLAAANPFSDVPEGHWAYEAVERLANEGIIEGYGDGTFRGTRNITRYEMAQMIARALAKTANYKNINENNNNDDDDGNINDNEDISNNENIRDSEDISNNEDISDNNKDIDISNLKKDKAFDMKLNAQHMAELQRLAVEFRDELESLGVRIENLEKHSDFLKWTGKIEYTYTRAKTDAENTGNKEKSTSNGYIFRFEPTNELNEHWKANARLDAEGDLKFDSTTNVTLKRIWAEGNYDKFNLKLGKMELFTNESGLIWDTDFSGAQLNFSKNDLQFTALGGRIKSDGVGGGILGEIDNGEDPSSIAGLNVQYENENGWYGGAGWYKIKDDDFKTTNYSDGGESDKANILSLNFGYTFNESFKVSGSYARNTSADTEKYSWQTQFDWGNYKDIPEKGDWNVFTGYRRYGTNTSFAPTSEDVLIGTKGWFVGANYSPLKNIGIGAKYFKGKYITNGGNAENILGRVEFFF